MTSIEIIDCIISYAESNSTEKILATEILELILKRIGPDEWVDILYDVADNPHTIQRVWNLMYSVNEHTYIPGEIIRKIELMNHDNSLQTVLDIIK